MSNKPPETDYLLGVNLGELERLRFQHTVWKRITDNFFDRLGVQQGWKCLDVGSGPGFVSMDLRDRVGESGEVTALEQSQFYLDWFRQQVETKGWTNARFIHGAVEQSNLPPQYYDLIFVRWVLSFSKHPEKFFQRLATALRPGGIIAVQDYWYEGLSMYPRGTPFDRLPAIVRAYYDSGGGDPYVAGRIPSILRSLGLRTIDFTPNQLAGGPESNVWEWMDRFLTHLPTMVERGVISSKEADQQTRNWNELRRNPDAMYFSPIVVDVAGRS